MCTTEIDCVEYRSLLATNGFCGALLWWVANGMTKGKYAIVKVWVMFVKNNISKTL
jgi:hypothetical protein